MNDIDDNDGHIVIRNGLEIIAISRYHHITDKLIEMHNTIVSKKYRGKGVGRFLNQKLENYLRKQGVHKIQSTIYVDNLPSIVLKLKLGYLIEGLLRDHEEEGKHEYILGKVL